MSNLGFHCHSLDAFDEVVIGNGLERAEFYNLPGENGSRLGDLVTLNNLHWSIHAPLFGLEWYPQPPTWSFLCDTDREKRDLSFKMINLTTEQAESMGAEYVVVHFPSPCSDASGEGESKMEAIAWRSCEKLAELSLKKNMAIHIEGVGSSPFINSAFLTAALKDFTPLKYCFDIAHSFLASVDNEFDLYDFEKELVPYIGSIHLWNTRGHEDYLEFRHIPVHPSQNTAEGWIDVPRALQVLGELKNSVPIIFESERFYPRGLGNHDYREGVNWVKDLLRT